MHHCEMDSKMLKKKEMFYLGRNINFFQLVPEKYCSSVVNSFTLETFQRPTLSRQFLKDYVFEIVIDISEAE